MNDLLKRSITERVRIMLLVFIGCGSVCILLMLAGGTPAGTPFDIGIGAHWAALATGLPWMRPWVLLLP